VVEGAAGAVVALPIVLPPTVIGFYLLVLMGPNGPVGQFTQALGLGLLPFTFAGLVVASVFYSLPFVVQPLQNAFEAIPERPLEAAATLRASPLDAFFSVGVPLARPGYLTASVLGFAHTVGEFGVVLMIGGNIPDKTRVVSVQIYDHVEALEYAQAHRLAGGHGGVLLPGAAGAVHPESDREAEVRRALCLPFPPLQKPPCEDKGGQGGFVVGGKGGTDKSPPAPLLQRGELLQRGVRA
jgi:molybdate transport system permease protein